MKLAQTILNNEREKQGEKNRQLVHKRLKELVYSFPDQVAQVLHKAGVDARTPLPPTVLLAVVIKHVKHNSNLREAIAKMLLEMDGYASADGTAQKWQVIGGAVSAVGSVLSGIGRSQAEKPNEDAIAQQQQAQQELDAEKAKSRRNMWLTIGIAAVVITAIIVIFKMYGSKPKPQLS